MLNTAFVVRQLQQALSHIRTVLDATDREPAADGGSSPDCIGTCTKPPAGWTCSRGLGHDGPCAATPVPAPSLAEVHDQELRLRVAAIESILLEINVEACIKHGLNPF